MSEGTSHRGEEVLALLNKFTFKVQAKTFWNTLHWNWLALIGAISLRGMPETEGGQFGGFEWNKLLRGNLSTTYKNI